MDKLLIAFLAKTLNLATESVAELLYKKSDDGKLTDELQEEALETLLTKDAERVAKIKPDTKKQFDNGYKKAEKEVAERWEGLVREQFGVQDTDLQGEDLLKEAKAKAAKVELDADKVKLTPAYLALERKAAADLRAKEEEFATQLANEKKQAARKSTISEVQGRGRKILAGLNPVLPKNTTVADNRVNDFVSKLTNYEFEGEGDDPVLVGEDGKRMEDRHGNPITLSRWVKEESENYFEFATQDAKGNAGNGGSGEDDKRQTKTSVEVPETEEAFNDQFFAATTMEEREALQTAWDAKQGAEVD